MSLTDKIDQIVQLMKETKESWVASEPENTDLAIYLHFWRGDDLAIMVQCPLERDTGLQAAQVGASGFGATTLSLTFESYHSTEEFSPNTGRRWEPHEMQYTFEAVPENREKHWVRETLTTSIHERGGAFALHSQPYIIEDWKVIWSEDTQTISSDKEGEGGGGVMFNTLQNAMEQPTIEDMLNDQSKTNPVTAVMNSLVDDQEQRLFHTDMATYRSLEEKGLASAVMFSAVPGSKRAEWIEERLGGQVLNVKEV